MIENPFVPAMLGNKSTRSFVFLVSVIDENGVVVSLFFTVDFQWTFSTLLLVINKGGKKDRKYELDN